MNLEEKLRRSRSTGAIDFSKYQSINQNDPLIKLETTRKILIEPNWTIPDDWEGKRYADYIAKHPEYDGVYVRSGLATRLEAAAQKLDDKCRLVVRAGHRPIEVQRRILKECAEDYKKNHRGHRTQKRLSTRARLSAIPTAPCPRAAVCARGDRQLE